ncbi:hypothetical protein JY651_48440 [Pyxidicoccus parkwayensis]|uniref:Uncharacterized protein n=1 Tax=Pyxidicoccus parkwayensis TaxID=2813578 RepID=A0ABX7NVA4_9BACT|nr:DUF6304 family protein [Pyxidicoccus parkwaysis]QSQ22845.1 hypothetical protein JY651_48440 [Pyxidicoccus parkwaysis]
MPSARSLTFSPPLLHPGTYRDAHGTEPIVIHNDGHTLSTRIRGCELSGADFDGLTLVGEASAAEAAGLTLNRGDLCACELSCELPLQITTPEAVETAVLRMRLVLGSPDARGGIDSEVLHLELDVRGQTFRSSGTSGWFEDELLDVQRKLPGGLSLRACITCAFSDYSPYGHGLFGCMACFRDNKQGYRAAIGKKGLFEVWSTLTGYVQETYVCPEFERRTPGTGYRG